MKPTVLFSTVAALSSFSYVVLAVPALPKEHVQNVDAEALGLGDKTDSFLEPTHVEQHFVGNEPARHVNILLNPAADEWHRRDLWVRKVDTLLDPAMHRLDSEQAPKDDSSIGSVKDRRCCPCDPAHQIDAIVKDWCCGDATYLLAGTSLFQRGAQCRTN